MKKHQLLKVRAEIDEFNSGKVSGWFISDDLPNKKNTFILSIDDKYSFSVDALNYRADLDALGISNGLVGFQVPLYASVMDNKKHSLKLLDSSGNILRQKNITLEKTANMLHVQNSILSIQRKKGRHVKKNIALIASYIKKSETPKFLSKLIDELNKANYTVVLILALDQKIEKSYIDLETIRADIIIKRKNIGYDFGSWASAVLALRDLLFEANNVLFINDSIIGPFFSLSKIIKSFEQSKSDLWGVCDSYDHRHHLQSYFFGFHRHLLQSPYFDSFFLHENPIPTDKNEAVKNYELYLLEYFKQNNFSYGSYLKYPELIKRFHKNASKILGQFKVNKANNSIYHNKQSDLSITLQPISFLVNTLSQIENSVPLNPSHYFSHEILEAGFPFIKKELLFKNPVNNSMIAYNRGIDFDSDTCCLLENAFSMEDANKYPAFITMD